MVIVKLIIAGYKYCKVSDLPNNALEGYYMIKIRKYINISGKKLFLRNIGGNCGMKKKNMTKANTVKCGRSHAELSVAQPIIKTNRLGLPVISGGGKTMREMYRETR